MFVCFWFIQTWGQVLDDKPMTVIPMASLVKVQSLTTFVSLSTSTDGLGLMDPLDGDQQLFCEKLLFLHWLFRLLKGAMQVEHLSHCTLSTPASSYKKMEIISCTITQLIQILSNRSRTKWAHWTEQTLTQSQVCAAARRLPSPIIPHSPAGQHSWHAASPGMRLTGGCS